MCAQFMGALACFVSCCWNVFDFRARAVTVQQNERKSPGGVGGGEGGKISGFSFSFFKAISVDMLGLVFICYKYKKVQNETKKARTLKSC